MATYKLRDTYFNQTMDITIRDTTIELTYSGMELTIPVDELTDIQEEDGDYQIVFNDDFYFNFKLDDFNNSGVVKLMSENYDKPFTTLYTTYDVANKLLYLCRTKLAGIAVPTQEQLNVYAGSNGELMNFNRNMGMPTNVRTVPAGSRNAVMLNTIQDGNRMVNFQNEYSRGRYYKKSTYNQLPEPKQNPFSRERIVAKTQYKARVPAVPRGGRKTRKGRKGARR
jgi:hypothetical protein